MINRKKTKKIRVGDIYIGGDAPVTVQTMVKVDAHDQKLDAAIAQKIDRAPGNARNVVLVDRTNVGAELLSQHAAVIELPGQTLRRTERPELCRTLY